MRPLLHLPARLAAAVALLGCAALSGCGNSSAPASSQPMTTQDNIQAIQNNSSIPPSAKATAIAQLKAKG